MHRTRPFDALGWTFSVASDDARIVDYVEHVYGGLGDAASNGEHQYLVEHGDDDNDENARLTLDGDAVATAQDAAGLVITLVHDVNRRALDATDLLAVHAGGVARGGDAVVLPAHMESGKTTLTAGLVRAGFDYLTDEAVVFDWDTLEIVPYAKPLSIDEGSWPLLPELEPGAPFATDGYKAGQWQVPAVAIRQHAAAPGCRARHLVFPGYAEGACTELVPLTRGEALVELAKNTFRFRDHGRRALVTLARIVEEVDCHRMPVGDLDEAVALIDALAATR